MAIFTGTINAETLTGDIGNDDMFGDAGNDTLIGAAGNDTLDGGLGADSLVGGTGNDIYVVDDIGDAVVELLNEGTDVVQSSITYTLTDNVEQLVLTGVLAINGTGNALDNLLTGNDAANVLSGGVGNDTLVGGAGNDTLDGGSGIDSMSGGLGDDVYIVDNVADVVVENSSEGYDIVKTSVSYMLSANVEDLLVSGTTAGLTLTGNDAANIITGGSGADTIIAGGGNDTIDTTAGGADTITLGAGNDSVVLSMIGPVTITDFNVAEDRLDLGTVLRELTDKTALAYDNPFTKGYLQVVASGPNTLVQVNDQSGSSWQTIATLQGVAPAAITQVNFRYNLDPSAATDGHATGVALTASSSGGVLEGWDGNDTITGGAGNDLLDGGFGGNDSISGGDGADTIFGFGGNDTLEGGANGDFIYGGSGNDLILGGDGDDRTGQITYKGYTYTYDNIALEGGDGNDTVDGGAGDDKISGGHGDDSLIGGLGADYLVDAAGSDTMLGGEGNDTLNDNGDGGMLFGEAGDDRLTLDLDTVYGGHAVASLLDGGDGSDMLQVLTNASGSVLRGGEGNDTIYASSSGLNRVVVDGGGGNDSISNAGWANTAWTIAGGEGDDRIEMGGDFHQIDAGGGNDTIDFEVAVGRTGSGTVTTGSGVDVIELSLRAVVDDFRPAVIVTDFTGGAGGDKFDLVSVIDRLVLPVGTDPFAGGYLRLVASGNNTYVEATTTPGAGAVYFTMAVLQGVAPTQLTADNFVQTVTPVVVAGQAPAVELPHQVALLGSGATPLGLVAPTDPDGGTLTITLSSLPDKDTAGIIQTAGGVQLFEGNTVTADQLVGLTFTPAAGATGYGAALIYTVTDDSGHRIRTGVIMEPQNAAPAANTADQVYTADGTTPFSYDLKTVVSDTQSVDNVLTYAVTVNGGALPAWLTFDPHTHVLTGTAPAGTDVAYTVGLSVTDPQGLVTTTSFMLMPPALTINGTAGNDSLIGHAGSDTLNGLAGNDTLDGGSGKDNMTGGLGNDVYVVDNPGDVVVESAGEGTDDQVQSSISYTLGSNVEHLMLVGTAAINGAGNELDNSLVGNTASNLLAGNAGNDTLDGAGGGDTLDGGAGNDTYYVRSASDTIVEAAGNGTDTLYAAVNYTLSAGVEIETLLLTGVATSLTGNELNNTLIGGASNDTLSGMAGNDSLVGGAGTDTLLGGDGNDTLNGGVGSDVMGGGAGNDLYYVDSAGDIVSEGVGGGSDLVYASVNYTLTAGSEIETAVLLGTATGLVGNSFNNTLVGGALADTLDGQAGNDSLAGGAGNDTLLGGVGNDTLNGGAGNDSMVGGAGNDVYYVDAATDVIVEAAGGGTDTINTYVSYTLGVGVEVETMVLLGATAASLTGNETNNALVGSLGNDVLNGMAGNDSLNGGAGNDTLLGGDGNDTLNGGTGADSMGGGAGNDVYYVDSAADVIVEAIGGGTDSLYAYVNYTLGAGVEVETMNLLGTANALTGNELGNYLIGSAANDTLSGMAGDDRIGGGAGNDLIDGGAGNDTLYGSNGNDTLLGGDGNDTLNGESGIDSMVGGAGNDLYYVDTVSDIIVEAVGGGTDTVYASANYTLGAGVEVETMALIGATANALTGNEFNNSLVGGNLNDMLSGMAGDDALNGGAGNDTLLGGDGNDTLTGGLGNDSLVGGLGNDVYYVDAAGDSVVEAVGGGSDIVYASANYTLGTGSEVETMILTGSTANALTGNELNNSLVGGVLDDTLSGLAGNDSLNGGAGNDTLLGGDGNDTLNGSTGADSMVGGAGNDLYYVDSSGDTVVEAVGGGSDIVYATANFTLSAGSEVEAMILLGATANALTGNELNNSLVGGALNDTLTGLAGNDTLSGGAGNDTLSGGAGNDVLTGGAGADQFVFDAAPVANLDTITDFVSGTDKLALSSAVYTSLGVAGALDLAQFSAGAGLTAATGAEHLVFNTTTGALYYDADGAGGAAAVQIAALTGVHALSAADFTVL